MSLKKLQFNLLKVDFEQNHHQIKKGYMIKSYNPLIAEAHLIAELKGAFPGKSFKAIDVLEIISDKRYGVTPNTSLQQAFKNSTNRFDENNTRSIGRALGSLVDRVTSEGTLRKKTIHNQNEYSIEEQDDQYLI